MLTLRHYAFFFLVGGLISCGNETTTEKTKQEIIAKAVTLPNHVKYIFYKHNEKGRKPKMGDLLTFHYVVQNHKDSVLSTTYGKDKEAYKEQPYEDVPSFFTYKPFFREVFALAAEGDSLTFWISVDSLANKSGYLKIPKVQSGTYLKYTLKMLRIRSKEEIKLEMRQKYAAQVKKDSLLIENYIAEIKKKQLRLELQTTASGLRYFIRKTGKGNLPKTGDTVMVNYTEKSLEGSLYGKSDAPIEFIIGETMPLGLEEGLSLMTEGASSVFILPSNLGYGDKPPHENIPQNAILVYEIDMIRLKH